MSTDQYTVARFHERYASREMQYIFSQDKKFSHMEKTHGSHWLRQRWNLDCAENGKPVITQEQIDELKGTCQMTSIMMWQRKERKRFAMML